MSLWEEIQPYLDKETGLLAAPDGGRDNLILYSVYLYREMGERGERRYELLDRALRMMGATRVAPGLYLRHPGSTDGNSLDNLVGAAFIDFGMAYERWETFGPYFNAANPSERKRNKYWYGRFPGLKAYIKACAGIKLNAWDKLLWSVACIFNAYFSRGASDPLLQNLQNHVMSIYGYCPFARKVWARRYPSAQALYAEYFGKDHPMAK